MFTRASVAVVALSLICGTILTSRLLPKEAQAIPPGKRRDRGMSLIRLRLADGKAAHDHSG